VALNILGDPVDGNDIGTAVSNCLFMELFSSHPPGGDGLLLIVYLMSQGDVPTFPASQLPTVF